MPWRDPRVYVRADQIDPRTDTLDDRDVLSVLVTRDLAVVQLRRDAPALPWSDDVTYPRDKIVGVTRTRTPAPGPTRRRRGRGWRRLFTWWSGSRTSLPPTVDQPMVDQPIHLTIVRP